MLQYARRKNIWRYSDMKLFIDTANIDEIRAANELGVICGVTTNLLYEHWDEATELNW